MANVIRIAPLVLVIAASILCAQEPAKPPSKMDAKASLTALADSYQKAVDGVAADSEKRSAALQTWYLTSLERLQGERAKAGGSRWRPGVQGGEGADRGQRRDHSTTDPGDAGAIAESEDGLRAGVEENQ